jgi:hypothetical protein
MALVNERYRDFSPTFAHEKLTEDYGFRFSVETLRQWMITDELWLVKSPRKACIHPRRSRRSSIGELIQIDGSSHNWFEGRAPS